MREREPRDHGAAPVEQAGGIGEAADRERGQRQLRGAEAEDVAPHRQQPAELELEPDQEQQHHDAELGDRDDAFRRRERREPVRADDDAGDEIGDDGRQPEPARDRHAQDRGGEQHEAEREKAEFAVLLSHGGFRGGVGPMP